MTDFRKQKPESEGNIEFSLPTIEEYNLDHGIRLLYVHKQNLPVTQFEVIMESGSAYDPQNKRGLAYLTAMLMDEGAGEYDSLQLSDEIEKIGSVLSISADKDAVFAAMLCMSEYIERSVELLSTIINSPKFSENDFNREKSKLMTKLVQTQDNPSQIANNVFDELMYKDTCYSHPIIGRTKSVSSFNHKDVKEFYTAAVKKSRTTIIAVGSEPGQKVLELINKYVSKAGLRENKIPGDMTLSNSGSTRIYLIDSPDAGQSEIRIGHLTTPRNSGDYFSKHIMNAILGGQFSSRINLNLREDKGFTYGASSYFNYNKRAGAFTVSTAVQSEVTADAVFEILREMKDIRNGVENSELDFAKSYLIKRFPALFETYMQITNNLGTMVLYDLEKGYFNKYLENIEAINEDSVIQAAKNYVHPDKSVILIHGDSKKLLPGLKDKFDYKIEVLDKDGKPV